MNPFEKILDRLRNAVDKECASSVQKVRLCDAVQIVQKVAEECNGGWIPCSERLPDIEADVLLTLRSLDIYTGFRANADGYFHVHGTDNKYIPFENVIAWQQLPEPFKERD